MSAGPEARFDRELAAAARRLVTDDLPSGILDAGLAHGSSDVRLRRPVPALAGVIAVLVVVLATVIALAPGGLVPGATPVPPSPSPSVVPATPGAFRSTPDIRADFQRLGYTCVVGSALPSVGLGPSAVVREGAICTAPVGAGPYVAAVIVGEAADGSVVDLHVKADLTGPDSPESRTAIAMQLAKSIAIAAAGQGVGNELAQWVANAAPAIEPSGAAGTELIGFSLKVVRNPFGGYQLLAHPI